MAASNRIHVKVKAFGMLSELTRDRVELNEHATIRDYFGAALKANPRLTKIIIDPDTNEASAGICTVVNGSPVDKLEWELADGDELTFFIGVGGG
jgi:molybdopterin converting factor small subunit